MVRCTENLLMRLFRVFIRAQSEFLFRCYSDPEDLEPSDRYIAVPHKNDLGLGRRLALAFVDQELSDEYDTVAGFFGRRGAYGRFKALLQAHGMLERWYEFENRAMEDALLAWCEENGIQPVDG